MNKFKKCRLHINKQLYNAAQYKVHKLIFNKEKYYFENKLIECIDELKELRKYLKSLGLLLKSLHVNMSALFLKMLNYLQQLVWSIYAIIF